jgi:hypothetical protein
MRKTLLIGLAFAGGLTFASSQVNNSIGFANFFYQKGFNEGYKQGYEKGYKEGYLQALRDAKILLQVANEKIKAVRAGCQLLEEKYGEAPAIIAVRKGDKTYLKAFISSLDLVDNWHDLVEFGVPLVKVSLFEKFGESSRRVLSIPNLDEEGEVETKPPKKEFIAELPKKAIESLKAENIPFVEIKEQNKVIAVFKSEAEYKKFCSIYKVCK